MLPKASRIALILALTAAAGGCAWFRPDLAARVATGTTAHDLCTQVFVTGLAAGQVFDQAIRPRPGLARIAPLLDYRVDREGGEVSARLAGGFTSRAVFLGERGCRLVAVDAVDAEVAAATVDPMPNGEAAAVSDASPDASPDPPRDPSREPSRDQALTPIIDQAFAERPGGPGRHTLAVVVLHRGRLVAERYAAGVDPRSRLLGFSLAKSVTSALAGVLVTDGRLDPDEAVGVRPGAPPEAASAMPPPVTVDQALRMTTGLALDETGSGFDPSNHMLYLHTEDMAAFARRARPVYPPGQHWAYSSASTQLVARRLAEIAGGGDALRRLASERLFQPIGATSFVIEADGSGTPIGAHYVLATARDWARFGQLYLDNGLAPDGRRLLDPAWIRTTTTPTLDTSYGAGWWLNRRTSPSAGPGMPLLPGLPADTFYGLGNLGQWLVIIPSRQLVVVRLGFAHTRQFDVDGMAKLVGGLVDATAD